ncbi:MAG TPA: hypothetical protein VFW52_03565 [Candidatus Saccharimonadales bacterium]|nr:hypothetical protein [Candidatus Saccharimonadales bacterium]
MKRHLPSFWQQTAAASLAVIITALVPVSVAIADTKPYFITQYGGPFAGGAFKDSAGLCSTNYQTPYSASPANYFQGAIMAFGTVSAPTTRSGAHSEQDAFALGKIEGNGAKQYGLYSGISGNNALSFSNSNTSSPSISDFWGGNLEGLLSYSHCIPDYYGTKSGSATQSLSGSQTISGRTIAAGGKQLIFVNGNVFINGDIQYAAHDSSNIPKFALVVKGNIYISPDVHQLDGWYIAQPNGAAGGEIWTCHDGTNKPTDQWMRDKCDDNRLTVNGAITAAHVYLGRISGNLGSAPAETVNFTPEMVLGGPFFDETSAGSDSTGAIQSLISLPPIF